MRALVQGVKTSEDDLFSPLAAAGAETVGDVSVQVPGVDLDVESPLVDSRECSELSFRETLERSLDWRRGLDRLTVSGIQPKVSAGMISLPVRARSRRREFLLKLASTEYPRLVENEAFFMELARSAGIDTAKVELVHDRDGEAGLLVERFDRVFDREGAPRKLHQEDACQLLDRYPGEKYRLGLRDLAEALDVCSAPRVERSKLLRLQAFSYLIANGDLHAKNISVHVKQRLVALTPAYDLLSTLPYGDEEMALKLEGRDKRHGRADFLDFGERIGVRRPAVEKLLDHLVKSVRPAILRLGEIGLDQRKTHHLARVIGELLRQLEG